MSHERRNDTPFDERVVYSMSHRGGETLRWTASKLVDFGRTVLKTAGDLILPNKD